jgi:hypothetical protein
MQLKPSVQYIIMLQLLCIYITAYEKFRTKNFL